MATSKVVVEGSSVTASQLKDLFRQIGDGSLGGYHIQALLEHRNPFEVPMDRASQLNRWQLIHREFFNIDVDTDSLVIPEQQPGFDRLIVIPKGLTLNQVIKAFRERFTVDLYVDDLDKSVTVNDRTNTKTYAIWVRERIEADEENANLSANDCKEKKINGQTLIERLLQEAIYFTERCEHLDIENLTLCMGSCNSGGSVPGVSWYAGLSKLCVSWHSVGNRFGSLRARAVVS